MKTIALIDTRLEVPGVSLGILVSTHPDVMAAFAANDAFQKAEASGRHIRTKIVTLKVILLRELTGPGKQMSTIALIDTRLKIRGESIGTVVSTHDTIRAAFKANEAFQKRMRDSGVKDHVPTKIVTLKVRLGRR
jgi:hypothetical protein